MQALHGAAVFGLVALPPPSVVDTSCRCDHQEANAPGFLGLLDDKPKPMRTLLIAAFFGIAAMFLAVSASHAIHQTKASELGSGMP